MKGRDIQICKEAKTETEVRLKGRDRQTDIEGSEAEWYILSMFYGAENKIETETEARL